MDRKRDSDMESAGTHAGKSHATDTGPDQRAGARGDDEALNDRGQIDGMPEGDQAPSTILGTTDGAASATDDAPVLGDEGGGSRYGDDDGKEQREGNEYSAPM